MVDSRPDDGAKVFSVRIVSIDYYTAPPIPGVDVCYSSFQGEKVNEVPVIRVYGSTPAGQKTCLHIHRAFPYMYVPCSDIPLNLQHEGDGYTNAVALALEKALKLKGNATSKKQHVHDCRLVRAKRFYGYHSSEELFVKIYLYYPYDVFRAANLLLAGAVFDKSLQPHESHIPFILQFLVDYNLYGMGHIHLSKMKFRNPVPDVFCPRKFSCCSQQKLEDTRSCTQAELGGGKSLDSLLWLASTIPCDWMWQFPGALDTPSSVDTCCIKRQSVCELEGDATVDEILNQQFKSYTSLSQTHSDVKMVQSLISIWEEEYERTGILEAAVRPDPGKPVPGDVLKALLHDLEFQLRLTDLCTKSEASLPSSENDVSSTDGENLVEGGVLRCSTLKSEPVECPANNDVMGSLPLQSSASEEKTIATPFERKDACPKLLSVKEIQSSEVIGTLDPKTTDTEALGLLRWLATSRAAEDINSDDELVRETILSPLLPATTIDKVLEKASIEYESASQKECQDILDSIQDFLDLDGLKKKDSLSVEHKQCTESSSGIKISQGDDSHSSPGLFGNSSWMGGESNGDFMHQALESTGMSVNNKRKRKRLLWGSLPFSMTGKVNDELKADACVKENENYVGSTALTKNEKGPDAVAENAEGDVYEPNASVGCTVRDLMRRKRCHRVAQKDFAYSGVRKVLLEDEEQKEDDIILPKRLDFLTVQYDDQVNEPLRSLNLGSTLANQQMEFHGAHDIGILHSGSLVHQKEPFGSVGDSSLLFDAHPPPKDAGKEDLKCLSNCGRQESAASMCEADAHKDFDVRSLASAEAIASIVHNFRSHSTSVNSFPKVTSSDNRLDQVNPVDPNCLSGSSSKNETFARSNNDHQCEPEVKSHAEKSNVFPYQSFTGMNVLVDVTILKNENNCDPEEVSAFSAHGTLISTGVNINQRTADLIGMTPCKKPPISERKDGACASFRHPLSGKGLDELVPFFEKDFPEKERDYHKFPADSCTNAQQEVVIGVPTHYQNDGSILYLLTPVLSPPSGDCVNRWLQHGNKDNSGETSAASIEPLIVKGPSRIRSESSSPVDDLRALTKNTVSHETPILNKVPQQVNENLNKDIQSPNNEIQRLFLMEGKNEKQNECIDSPADISQISGPNGRSRPTPLSQIGFRDPASVGAGQQVTLLSIEVHAESRGDLQPDPRFDAINVVALAFQNDNDSAIGVHVLLHCNNLSYQRSSDGLSGCKVLVFSEEKHLFSHFIRMLGSIDPDILVGWDVQGSSLGFLAERAAYLGIGLLNSISRTPLETKIRYGESETSDKGMLDTVLQEPLITDPVLIEDAIVEDEWGRTHASGVHVGGRIVLNVWRLMRGEVKLNMYTVEAVAEAVLRLKVPSIPCKVLTKWFSSGSGQARYRCVEYVMQRARLNLDIMNQLDMINRTSELARVFGIDFFSVLSRGSQYRVESMLLRLAHTQNYLAISPGSQQVAGQPAMECLPLVMEPESGFYADPVVVLDFQSLYPSMIIAYNLCFCTCLGNVTPSKAHRLGVSSFSPDLCSLRDLKDEMLLTPNGVIYVPPKVRKGILPRLLEEILSTRIMVKQAMKKLAPSQQVLHRIFNARQLALKLIANVTYGYTAAGFSGRMPCAELADSIVQCGRSTLEKAISLVNANDKWKAKVIYGDTDSMFVLLKGRSIQESFQIGREIASAVTAMNPDPVTLKLEKVYHPCFLLTKKRYVGYSYESPDQTEPLFDAKGIETVRRDTCGAVAKIMEQSLRIFFEHQDISKVKMYLQRQWTRILSGRVSIQDFVFAKEVRLGTYSTRHSSSLPPAAIVATKAMRTDPRAEPRYAERVPYVVIHGEPGARLVDMVADPMDLLALDSPYRLNDIYYISKQIIPALQRVFGLVGADLSQWFSEMPRPVREAFAKRPLLAANPQRMRIDFYYLSKHCVLCGELVHASAHICNQCATNEVAAATAVIGRTSKLEREIQHLAAICRHCGGADWLVESGVKCTSLACSAFYERRKVQKELQGLSAVAADKGYYPNCTVEWF